MEDLIQRIHALLRRIPLLDRWLLGELIGPLLFAVALFSVLSLYVGVLFELLPHLLLRFCLEDTLRSIEAQDSANR